MRNKIISKVTQPAPTYTVYIGDNWFNLIFSVILYNLDYLEPTFGSLGAFDKMISGVGLFILLSPHFLLLLSLLLYLWATADMGSPNTQQVLLCIIGTVGQVKKGWKLRGTHKHCATAEFSADIKLWNNNLSSATLKWLYNNNKTKADSNTFLWSKVRKDKTQKTAEQFVIPFLAGGK